MTRALVIAMLVAGCQHDDAKPTGLPPAAAWQVAPHGPIATRVDGIPGPDPKRAIDPTHHLSGVVRVGASLADRVTDGGAVFVMAKRADANGQPVGMPLAVTRLAWAGREIPFELTERQAMVAQTTFAGDVVVIARFDRDGDAFTKQPGDLSGLVRTSVPSTDVAVTLDTLQP